MSRADREGLSLGYRMMWRIRYVGMHVYGPAQLGEFDDPHERLKRERAQRVATARQSREDRGR